MPFYQFPVQWSEKDHGIAYTAQEFHERIAKNMQVLEAELAGTDLMNTVVNHIKFLELDRILNGCVN